MGVRLVSSLVTNNLQNNYFLFVFNRRKKLIHVWNNLRVSKWLQHFHLWKNICKIDMHSYHSPDTETWAPMYFFFAFIFLFCVISSSLLPPSDSSASKCCCSFVSVTSVFLFLPFLREAIFFWVKNKQVIRHI